MLQVTTRLEDLAKSSFLHTETAARALRAMIRATGDFEYLDTPVIATEIDGTVELAWYGPSTRSFACAVFYPGGSSSIHYGDAYGNSDRHDFPPGQEVYTEVMRGYLLSLE